MDHQQFIDIKQLSDLIKNLHNHEKINFSQQFGSILSDPIQIATLNLLNLEINDSLDNLKKKPENAPKYFERQAFFIGGTQKKVGQIVKILSSLCQFEDPRQKNLAGFETVSFYQETQRTNNIPPQFIDFLKGIFPSMNVHKDNIPLYMPFWQRLENYNSMIGNPNWEISRHNLDLIYRSQILAPQEKPENWYLLLTGSRKLLEVYQNTSIQKVWAHMYSFYVNSTLKPYRYINSKKQPSEEVDLRKIIEIILENIKTETNNQIIHLLSLIMYVLTKNSEELEKSFMIFENEFKELLSNSKRNPETQKLCSEWGLINSMYCQLLHNLLKNFPRADIDQKTEFDRLEFTLDSTIQLTQTAVQKAIPYSDCYLRIAFSSYTQEQKNIKESNQHILSTLKGSLSKSTKDFPFLVYGYWDKEIYEPFSTVYLEKYPEKILDLVNYLRPQVIVWKLLNSKKLNDFEEFQKIRNCLQEHKKSFILQIQRTINITEEDFQKFFNAWIYFFDVVKIKIVKLDIDYHIEKAINCRCALRDIQKIESEINQEFKNNIYLPFQKSENILRATNKFIEGFDEHICIMNNDKKTEVLKEQQIYIYFSLSFLLDEQMKKNVIGALSQDGATEFWKKWTSVYMNDEDLVAEITNSIQAPLQINGHIGLDSRVEESKPKPKQISSEIMEIQ